VQQHHRETSFREDLLNVPPLQRLTHMLNLVDRYAAMISPRQSREARSAIESTKSILSTDPTKNNQVGQALLKIVGFFPPGTFVQLDDASVGVVMRRRNLEKRPDIAIVLNDKGQVMRPPCLLASLDGHPTITAAVPASRVQEHLNHHLILQLGALAG
jgi:hypothetical protein